MPALCSFLLGGRIAERDNLIVRLIKKAYFPTLRWSLRLRWLVVLGAIALFALAMFIFRHLGADFIPKLDEGTFTMMVYRSPSISLDESLEQQRKTEREIPKRVPEVTHVFSRIGSAETAIFTSTTNRKTNGEG
jgi:cobalt-zinc-cadmium resistance protein CzcA